MTRPSFPARYCKRSPWGCFGLGTRLGKDIILDKMEWYFKNYIDGINLFLFVFKKGRFTKEEKEVFTFIREKFDQEISPISAVAVTGCENDSPAKRQDFIRDFRSNAVTKQIAFQMQLGVHPVGFPPLEQYDEELQEHYQKKMLRDQQYLWNLIIKLRTKHMTKQLFVDKVKPVIIRKWCTML